MRDSTPRVNEQDCPTCFFGGKPPHGDPSALARRLQTALDRGIWPAAFVQLDSVDRELIIHALHAYGHGGHITPLSQPIEDLSPAQCERVIEGAIKAIDTLRTRAIGLPTGDFRDGQVDAYQSALTELANLPIPVASKG
jgi:hypothetical protein